MPKANPLQPSYNAGEFSPRMAARTDFNKYPFAGEIVENLIPLAEGAMMRRSGTRFVVEVKDSSAKCRLKKFQFSTQQAYVLELGNGYMRFCRYQGQIVVGNTDAAIANGTFLSDISSWTDRSSAGSSIAWDGANLHLSLIGNGTVDAHAEQAVTVSVNYRNTEHVLKFRTFGAPGDKIKLRIGRTSKGTEIINDREIETGFHCVAFTPSDTGSAASTVSSATGTVISNFDAQSANAFDDNASQVGTSCAYKAQSIAGGYIGKDWGNGNSKKIVRYTVSSSSNAGFTEQFNSTITLQLRGSNTAPTATGQGTLLDSQSFADISGLLTINETSSLNVTTAYRYHWIEVYSAQVNASYKFYVGEVVFYESTENQNFYVQFLNSTNKTLGVDDVSLIASAAVEIATPWGEDDLPLLNGPQSADELYFFNPAHPPYRLERRGHTTWSLVEAAWQDGPYLTQNNTATTLTPAALTGFAVSVTASATAGINDGDGFKSTDVGRLLRLSNPSSGTDWGWGVIVSQLSATQVLVDVKRDFKAMTATADWRIGAWSGTTGYPTTGTFYEQRLSLASTSEQPQTFWMSQTGDFENMAPDSANSNGKWDGTVEDDDAIDYTISADSVNTIKWMSAGENTVVIGTVSGEWTPQSTGAVLTPSDISVRLQTTHGSASVGPVRVDHSVLFVQRAGRKVREFVYDFNINGYTSFDMTRLAAHVTKGGVVEVDFAAEPHSLMWGVRADGQAIAMTYRREEDVVGWSRHKFGGSTATSDWGIGESVVVIPGADGTGQVHTSAERDEVWFIVQRAINGQTKRYIEVLEHDYEHDVDDQTDAYYADCMVTYDGTAALTITGLSHLNQQEVAILADGAVVTGKTIVGGQVTLDVAASKVHVGLPYTHRYKRLKLEAGAAAGSAIGKPRKIAAITFLLLDCGILKIGPDEDHLLEKDFRVVSDAMDGPPPLFTGEQWVPFNGTWEKDPRVWIEDNSPLPFTLLGMAMEVETRDVK